MTKKEFLTALSKALNGLPQQDINRYLEYYGEMIDDRMEEGLAEEEAVAAMENVDVIAERIKAEQAAEKTESQPQKAKKRVNGWFIAAIIGSSVFWLPILIVILAVIGSFIVAAISVLFSFYAVPVALLGSSAALIGTAIYLGFVGESAILAGASLIFVGIAILWFILTNTVLRLFFRGIKALYSKIKDFIAERRAQK